MCEGRVGRFGGEKGVDGTQGGMFEDDWRAVGETAGKCVSMSAVK